LTNTVILKTRWGTDAVYRLLDHKRVLDRHGRFDRRDLAAIWHEPEYAPMREQLVHLMMKFELCYPIEGGSFIAPQLLEPHQPAYEWPPAGDLVVKYAYDFMPKGILTRLIVATHHLIEDQRHVWKSGVVLGRDGARAEVVENYQNRQLAVRLIGRRRRELLAVIDNELERIHRTFPRLKLDRLVPCQCTKCGQSPEPHYYPYEVLRRFAGDRNPIQCQRSYEMLEASTLLDEVFPDREQPRRLDLHIQRGTDAATSGHPATPATRPLREVFLSYAWGGESDRIADELAKTFAERGIPLVRDRNEMRYRDSILDFMNRLGRGKAVVVVLSRKYLESKSCMFELTQLGQDGVGKRVFPIVLEDADLYEPITRVGYIKHWEEKKRALNEAMKDVDGEHLQGIREDLDLYSNIRNTAARLMDILGDMNARTSEAHRKDGFRQLLDAVEAKLAE
jgi:RocCOR-like putative regulator of kinase activity/TIR domain-containing protein